MALPLPAKPERVSRPRNVHAQRLLSLIDPGFRISRGSPLPFGATMSRSGINFSVFSKHATSVSLVLFCPGDPEPALELPLDPRRHRTGDVWHVLIQGLIPNVEYGYRMARQPNERPEIHRFDPDTVLLDPWARKVTGGGVWGSGDGARRALVRVDEFDWEHDQPLNIPLVDSVIYELHVRGFTMHASSCVARPGTFSGLTEKIPYLKELGVTAVELLPVHEFDECENVRLHPATGEPLRNFWGYQPISFFAPNSGYASTVRDADATTEFRSMVKRFHQAGIEVILDVVFNHTAEGDYRGTTQSFRGIDNSVYYVLDPCTGSYHNYSGTGNTLNCNHPVVREMIASCLRYWVTEMHVDGFRFDLASVLGRGQDGGVLASPPLLESLAHDPILGRTKLIAEAWDAAGLYQVGSFPAWSRWAEWNGKFRDDIRRFVRGDAGMVSALATRLCGSPDLYQTSNREPYHSINFVTAHDGFTLADLVSFNQKHNDANGEDNRDGDNDNHSWNCGHEGPAKDAAVVRLRERQVRNFLTLLLVSHGVPMLLAGDEFGRTQSGNNNAYCQDNEISWLDWNLCRENSGLLRFVQRLIAFRSEHAVLRRSGFHGSESHICWNGVRIGEPDWSHDSRAIAMHVTGQKPDGTTDHVYVIANAFWKDLEFQLPPEVEWKCFVDTWLDPHMLPDALVGSTYRVHERSVVVLVVS
jgi:glycogen operon protein